MEPITITLHPRSADTLPRLGAAVAFKRTGSSTIYVGYLAPRPERATADFPNGETFIGHDNTKASPADVTWWAEWGV